MSCCSRVGILDRGVSAEAELAKIDHEFTNFTELSNVGLSAELLLHRSEVLEVLIGDVEESVDFLISTHAIITPEFLKELLFGGGVMV